MSEVLERLELPPERGSIPRARQFLRKVLGDDVTGEALEIAELLTSELVTNAVLHSGTPLEVRVSRHRSRVRVEVADRTEERPVLRKDADPLALNGRGLQFVDRLATKWGVVSERHGKAVWFEV